MDVSTRAGAGGRLAGARLALRHAAWVAPLLLPLGILQALLLIAPWLGSVQAISIDQGAAPLTDWLWHERVELVLALAGGIPGAALLATAAIVAWLLVLRRQGPWRESPPWALHGGSHHLHALRLASVLAGATAYLVLTAPSRALDRLIDAVTSLRPTAPQSLALLLVSQVLPLLALGAVLGATVALARIAHVARLRAGCLAVLAGLALAGAASQLAAARFVSSRFDVGLSLADATGASASLEPRLLVALARDRAYPVPMLDGLAGARFSAEAASRAQALLDARRGWSLLSADAERFVIGERLLALDPEGARQRALDCVLRPGQPATALALLRALGSAAPSPGTRRQVDALETSELLHLGPQATLLIARAHAQAGDRQRAESALARLRSGGEDAIVRSRAGVIIVHNRFTRGSIRGRLLLDGMPHRGRIGLMSIADVFSLPPNDMDVNVTWLLRLTAATPCDAEGAFAFEGLPEGEHALVLLLPDLRQVLPPAGGLPRLEVSPQQPQLDLGIIDLGLRAGGARSRE